VDVLYSTNGVGGPYDKTIATLVDATLGQLNWNNVADTLSANTVVKVVDTGNANVYGLTGVFNITGSVTVGAPNGNEDWAVAETTRNITWTKTGTIGNVNIYVDYGAGYGGTPIATIDSALGLYNWNPIPDQVSNNVKIKIVDADTPAVYDESNAVFHITGSLNITYPDGCQHLCLDCSFNHSFNTMQGEDHGSCA
jgi:hypothetical protein